jgi:3-hydroxyacyl-CoA dehydrogenase/enoyl-CoA hydratase/carnithine racemase
MAAAVTIRRVTKAISAVVIDDPTRSLNVLSPEVLTELAEAFKTVAADAKLEGLIIASTKPSGFLAGADIGSFSTRLSEPGVDAGSLCRHGQNLFGQLAKLPLVTVAAVHGPCLGGGMELAMWCDRRIAADLPHTQLGFPEVKLGICPGWGGTARTPRMIGLANAVELITTGEPVGATAAYRLGLVDDIVPRTIPPEKLADELLTAAVRMIVAERASGQYLRNRERWSQPLTLSETELMFLGATAGAVIQQKTGGHYPAPAAALELMLEAASADLSTACELEAERFATLFGSPVNRALLNVFNLQQRAKSLAGGVPPPRSAQNPTTATIGAGTMGQGIAAANVRRGNRTLLADSRPVALTAAIPVILREAAYDKEAKRPTLEKTTAAAALLTRVDTDTQLATADVVIEAIIEDLAAKHALYERLEAVVSPQTILCSNTSTLPITQLAAKLKHPERFCGLHFFNPVRKMQLVEVIRGELTSDQTLATVTAYARALGKTPVVVRDSPGFLVNRLLMPYMNEALVLLTEDVPIKEIERAAKAFGMPMGPLTLHDVVGLDICQHAGRVLHAAYANRVVETPVLETLIAAGRLGQKNGRGFFDYSPSKGDGAPSKGEGPPKGKPSAEVEALLVPHRKPAAVRTDVKDRLILPMLLEAIRAVEEGVVADPRDVDLALILGIGFPPFRGGLFYWADGVGADVLLRKVESFAGLGARYTAPESLQKAATERRRLTDFLPTAHSPQPTS